MSHVWQHELCQQLKWVFSFEKDIPQKKSTLTRITYCPSTSSKFHSSGGDGRCLKLWAVRYSRLCIRRSRKYSMGSIFSKNPKQFPFIFWPVTGLPCSCSCMCPCMCMYACRLQCVSRQQEPGYNQGCNKK